MQSHLLLIYMILPPPPTTGTPDFLRTRPVANRILSRRDATVNTPPTIAQVLAKINQGKRIKTVRKADVRCDEMCKGLPCVRVDNKNWRNFEIEEGT